jgi:hypothetical protein
MYIDIVPNRRSPPAILLRESIREGGRVRKRTIANLSALPIEQAEMIRRVLKGEKLGPLESLPLRGHGLADRAPGGDRKAAGQAAPEGWRPRPV